MRRGIPVTAAALTLAAPAQAFDCRKAVSEIDKAICAMDYAVEANNAMEAAYTKLRGALGPKGKSVLLDGQRAWITYRDERCGPVTACLAEESDNRTQALEVTPAGMAPWFLFQVGVDNGYEVKLEGYRFTETAGAAEDGYNRWLDRLVKDSPYGDPPDTDEDHHPYSWEANIPAPWLTARLISAVAWNYYFSGGAHPNSSTDGLFLDRKSARMPSAAALFGKEGLDRLQRECAEQIVRADWEGLGDDDIAQGIKQLDETYPGVVAETVRSMERWHVDADGVHVRFDSYAVAPYSAGPQECVFEAADIASRSSDAGLFAQDGQ